MPIQGTSADEAELALFIVSDYILNHGGMLALLLHDAIFTFFPEETAEEHALVMRDMLSDLPYQKAWGYAPLVRHPFDASVGSTWGAMKELK